MRRSALVVSILALAALPLGLLAKDGPDTAKRLVQKVPADSKHQHLDYYTGKYGFMSDVDLGGEGPLKKGFYLMSWLVLDPPIILGAGGGVASMAKDLLKDYMGVSELEVTTKNAKSYPVAGMKSKKNSEGIGKDGSWWIPINFQDLVDAKQGNLFASGNQFDWVEWGGTGLNQFHQYLFCLAKWSKGGKISFKAGSDDPETTWVNGVKTTEGLADRNWAMDTDAGEATVPAGEWVPILAEVGENGGECGYTLRVEPPPDDVTLDTEAVLAVSPHSKAPIAWGYLKTR
ncbi:hypothetical protein FJZ36_09770 [Candidatus Poribacteria bacterium]|nr:hypothetical protein [Candidatus Poribacteria bacterium]